MSVVLRVLLDHAFHVKRKTGQIMRILDRGTTSIQVCVVVLRMLLDHAFHVKYKTSQIIFILGSTSIQVCLWCRECC